MIYCSSVACYVNAFRIVETDVKKMLKPLFNDNQAKLFSSTLNTNEIQQIKSFIFQATETILVGLFHLSFDQSEIVKM